MLEPPGRRHPLPRYLRRGLHDDLCHQGERYLRPALRVVERQLDHDVREQPSDQRRLHELVHRRGAREFFMPFMLSLELEIVANSAFVAIRLFMRSSTVIRCDVAR